MRTRPWQRRTPGIWPAVVLVNNQSKECSTFSHQAIATQQRFRAILPSGLVDRVFSVKTRCSGEIAMIFSLTQDAAFAVFFTPIRLAFLPPPFEF